MNAQSLFEGELRRRGHAFSMDAESGRHAVEVGGTPVLVSLENLQRDLSRDGDLERVSQFVDSILTSISDSTGDKSEPLSSENLYWCLEPGDYEVGAEFRMALSERVDRVLVHLSPSGGLITWVTSEMLRSLDLSGADAGAMAFFNLARELREASVEFQDVDDVRLGFIGTSLPFKASLVLAPNLHEVVGEVLGWPLLAVFPDRDFLYLWAARHADFAQRVGKVVVREYAQASYPITTEVYEITDQEIRALGAFQVPV